MIELFLPAYLLTQVKDPAGKASHNGNWNYPSSTNDRPDVSKTLLDWPRGNIHLIFTAQLHIPTNLCPTFPYTNLEVFSALEMDTSNWGISKDKCRLCSFAQSWFHDTWTKTPNGRHTEEVDSSLSIRFEISGKAAKKWPASIFPRYLNLMATILII